MSFHFLINFDPPTANVAAFREELLRVVECSRREVGCIRMDVFESVNEPSVFAIHSEWTNETAFDLHATLPHTLRFLSAAEQLLGHPVTGLRLQFIGGGPGPNEINCSARSGPA